VKLHERADRTPLYRGHDPSVSLLAYLEDQLRFADRIEVGFRQLSAPFTRGVQALFDLPRHGPQSVISSTIDPACARPYSSVARTATRCVPGSKVAGRFVCQIWLDLPASTQDFFDALLRS